jgi:hypothetical protein
VKCRMGVSFRSGLKMATTMLGPYPLLPCGPCWKSYPDDLPFRMNLHLLYSPLDPTSNGEGVSSGEMLLDDALPAFFHNQFGSA